MPGTLHDSLSLSSQPFYEVGAIIVANTWGIWNRDSFCYLLLLLPMMLQPLGLELHLTLIWIYWSAVWSPLSVLRPDCPSQLGAETVSDESPETFTDCEELFPLRYARCCWEQERGQVNCQDTTCTLGRGYVEKFLDNKGPHSRDPRDLVAPNLIQEGT